VWLALSCNLWLLLLVCLPCAMPLCCAGSSCHTCPRPWQAAAAARPVDKNPAVQLPAPDVAPPGGAARSWLYENQLTAVPPELGDLRNLKRLWLDRNKIKHLPADLAKCDKLQVSATCAVGALLLVVRASWAAVPPVRASPWSGPGARPAPVSLAARACRSCTWTTMSWRMCPTSWRR
jgi:hypothetical protein